MELSSCRLRFRGPHGTISISKQPVCGPASGYNISLPFRLTLAAYISPDSSFMLQCFFSLIALTPVNLLVFQNETMRDVRGNLVRNTQF